MTIRPAVPADAAGIARVHVDSWRSTYAGLVPDAYLAALAVEQRHDFWTGILAAAPDSRKVLLVAERDGQGIVAFASGGPDRAGGPTTAGELYAIYLLQGAQGQGLGRALAEAFVARMQAAGYQSLTVWVLAENPACGFYAALGGVRAGEKTVRIGGADLMEWSYVWSDLSAFGTRPVS